MRPLFLLVLLMVGPQVPSPGSVRRSPDELARALQQRYDAVTDFSADFSHTYEGGVLKKKTTERGTLLVKKPGKMRWTYESPERKLFVSDGRKLYAYIPADNQVRVNDVTAEDQATTPALFLAGKGSLSRDFAATLADVPGAPAGAIGLKLVPKRSEQEYEYLILVVDPASLRIRMLLTTDAQGGRLSFTFTNLKENIGLSEREFTFTMPRGVEVIGKVPEVA